MERRKAVKKVIREDREKRSWWDNSLLFLHNYWLSTNQATIVERFFLHTMLVVWLSKVSGCFLIAFPNSILHAEVHSDRTRCMHGGLKSRRARTAHITFFQYFNYLTADAFTPFLIDAFMIWWSYFIFVALRRNHYIHAYYICSISILTCQQ